MKIELMKNYINENQKLAENQEQILKNSTIEESIKMTLNESHTKILQDNSKKNNKNKAIINRNNNNNIKSIKFTKNY
ncbi:hypothetical protein U3516DRAFT_739142 [Neocallimastix sp. 'constans']